MSVNPEGHSPRWWKQHPEELAKRGAEVVHAKVPQQQTPLHESTMLWTGVSTFFSILFVIFTLVTKDYRWLLFPAWPWGALVLWKIFSHVASKSRKLIFATWIVLALGLFALSRLRILRPPVIEAKAVPAKPDALPSQPAPAGSQPKKAAKSRSSSEPTTVFDVRDGGGNKFRNIQIGKGLKGFKLTREKNDKFENISSGDSGGSIINQNSPNYGNQTVINGSPSRVLDEKHATRFRNALNGWMGTIYIFPAGADVDVVPLAKQLCDLFEGHGAANCIGVPGKNAQITVTLPSDVKGIHCYLTDQQITTAFQDSGLGCTYESRRLGNPDNGFTIASAIVVGNAAK